MMKKAILITGMLLWWVHSGLNAQQFPLSSHYLANPSALNPAFAGTFSRSEFFMNYRRDWSAIEGSPRTVALNGDFRLTPTMHLGADIFADFADIFYRLRAGINYGIRLEVGMEQYLSFALSGHYYQSVIRLDQANVDTDDPLLKDLDRLFHANFNAGFGLVYSNRDLHLAFGMPVLFRTRDAYTSLGSGNFAFERAWNFYVTNCFNIHPHWDLRPALLLRKTINQPLIFDVSALFVYNKQLWLGALFRNTSLFGFTAGARVFDGMVLNYTFEAGFGGIQPYAGNTHEITLGFTRPLDDTHYYRGKRSGSRKTTDIREKTEQPKEKKHKKSREKKSRTKTKKPERTQPLQPLKYAPYEKF